MYNYYFKKYLNSNKAVQLESTDRINKYAELIIDQHNIMTLINKVTNSLTLTNEATSTLSNALYKCIDRIQYMSLRKYYRLDQEDLDQANAIVQQHFNNVITH